jgi:hypothetical protein
MAIAFVQSAGVAGHSLAFTSNNTAGNLLILAVGAGGAVTGVSDTRGNTWVKAVNYDESSTILLATEIWYAENCAGGANTVSYTGGFSSFEYMGIAEYSGVATSSSLDKTQKARWPDPVQSSAADSGATATTAQSAELLIGAIGNESSRTATWGGSFTERQDGLGTSRGLTLADRIVSSTGAYSATATLSGVCSWQSLIATFKAAAASDTTAPVVASANVNSAGTTLTIAFTEAGSPPVLPASSVTGFTLTASGGAVTLSSTAISSTTFTATTSRTIASGETLTLGYTPGNVTDSATSPNSLATFSGTSVANNSTQTATATTYTAPLSPTTITAGQTTTATITPDASYTGTITGTPSGSASTGLSAVVKTFSSSATPQSASWTPTAAGTLTITWTNSGSLTNPSNGTVTVNAAALAAGTVSFDSCGPAGGTAFVKMTATAATGGTPTYTYQWKRNVNGGSYSNLSGATSLTVTDATVTAGNTYGYEIVATDSAGTPATATSGAVTAQVYTGGALTGGGFRRISLGGGF